MSLFISSTVQSGQRYTPVEFKGNEVNPFSGEQDWRPVYDVVSDPAKRFSEVGSTWWWIDLSLQKNVSLFSTNVRFTLEVTNLLNQENSVIINPVTGEAYPNIDASNTDFTALRGNPKFDVTSGVRDPRYEDPNSSGSPPFNPARFLPGRHIVLGVSFNF